MNKLSLSRREFIKASSIGVAFPYVAKESWASASPNDIVNHASFGGAGMAGSDLGQIKSHPKVKVRAIAEIDPARRLRASKQFPGIKIYDDWREMLNVEGKHLDSVNVSTPDHMHASMGMAAMQRGLHLYGQKPLTHGIAESRALMKFAAKTGLVTQMGIQIHSNKEYRTAVKIVHEGLIGKVKEAHSFSNKRWGDSKPKPDRVDTVPDGLDWDSWIGPAPFTDYIKGYYHPGQWRKRLDYGTGTFGDMGCHIYDPTFKALGLTYPLSLRSEGLKPNQFNWGFDAKIHYEFPKTEFSVGETLPVTWYDGMARPPQKVLDLVQGSKIPGQGSIIIGTKGVMLLPHVGMPTLFPKEKFGKIKYPIVEGGNHWHEFIDAICNNGPTPSANFDYSGPLTETVLLGGIATRFPKETLNWDATTLSFPGNEEATSLIRRKYRKGWEMEGLG